MAYEFLRLFDSLCTVVRLARYHFDARRHVVLFVIVNFALCYQYDFLFSFLSLSPPLSLSPGAITPVGDCILQPGSGL